MKLDFFGRPLKPGQLVMYTARRSSTVSHEIRIVQEILADGAVKIAGAMSGRDGQNFTLASPNGGVCTNSLVIAPDDWEFTLYLSYGYHYAQTPAINYFPITFNGEKWILEFKDKIGLYNTYKEAYNALLDETVNKAEKI